MNTNIHSINIPIIVQIGWRHHVDFCVWKNRPLLLAKGVEYYTRQSVGCNSDGLTSLDRTCNFPHDDVIKWKYFPRYWPFVRGIHRSPVNSPHKGQWRGALMFYFICVWINGWVNNREAGDLRRYRAHYDVTVMCSECQRVYVISISLAGKCVYTSCPDLFSGYIKYIYLSCKITWRM